MSIAIDIDRVVEVLLSSGWIEVANNSEGVSSFGLDAYEYLWPSQSDCPLLRGGAEEVAGIPATGFYFTAGDGSCIMGPLTAIHAVKYAAPTEH